MAERLKQAGARFKNFPVYVNIQLYAAFVRPGLEYDIILIYRNRSGNSSQSVWVVCNQDGKEELNQDILE